VHRCYQRRGRWGFSFVHPALCILQSFKYLWSEKIADLAFWIFPYPKVVALKPSRKYGGNCVFGGGEYELFSEVLSKCGESDLETYNNHIS
jgi:hypothetical protein